MLCDKIMYRGQTLLTIYHQGSYYQLQDRHIKESEKIGRYNLTFTEFFVDDTETENIKDWTIKEEGLIEPGSNKNPYGDAACAYIIHYSYANKPSSIYSFKDSQYCLNIPIENLLHISEFVKKYTGIDIESNPMFYGDVFVCKCNEYEYKHNKTNGIIVKNIPANSTIIVHFKNDKMIVSSKIIKIDSETKELEITSDKQWDSHDIEVFNGEELIYFQKNVSYIRRISLKTTVKEKGIAIKLNKIGTKYVIQKEGESQISHIGEPTDEYIEILQKSSWKILKNIKSEKPDDQVLFIKPNELSKATELIGSTIESAIDELWLFDSYFTDMNGIGKNLDWLRIIANCDSSSKNVVFYCNDPSKALNITELKKEIKKDSVLSEMLRKRKNIGIHFYEVKSPIHDRFVLINNHHKFSGLSIGTSLNSLERNHYCISKLSHMASKIIYNELIMWMKDGNVVFDEGV